MMVNLLIAATRDQRSTSTKAYQSLYLVVEHFVLPR